MKNTAIESVKNWKTSLFGLGLVLAAVSKFLMALFDNDPSTVADFEMLLAALGGGGFLVASDPERRK